jgi:NAD+ diphosphatase
LHTTFFSGGRHDRTANDRTEETLIATWRADPAARFIPLWRGQHAFDRAGQEGGLRLLMPNRSAFPSPETGLDRLPWTYLGCDAQGPIFSVDLDAHDAPLALLPPGAGPFEALRPLAPLLPDGEPALLAQARGMHHWRRTHRFCGSCGHALVPEQGGHRLSCDQGHQHFPRTDPVVIMLVRHGERALLARGVRFPPGNAISALAGFVEPGESAEEAVAREVFEEVGVRVRDVRYLASQPWPFPGSLMLGFHAEAEETALTIDASEIVHARWVTRQEVRDADPADFTIPDVTAIARLLIESWLEEA